MSSNNQWDNKNHLVDIFEMKLVKKDHCQKCWMCWIQNQKGGAGALEISG